jgi:glycosyltransferase involved in cell wall biosynthesis
MNKILLIGPLSPPINGVSICNDKIIAIKEAAFQVKYINTADANFSEKLGVFSLKKMITVIKKYFFLYKIFSVKTVYITIGQTFFGVIKYFPFLFLSKILGKKSVIHIHGNYLQTEFENLRGIKKEIFKFTIKLATKGIVLSNSLKKNLTPFLEENNIYVLPNFVEDEIFNIGEKDIEKKYFKRLKILFLSNLMTEKGILDLLDSLKTLEDNTIEFEAKIAGNIDKNIKELVFSKINKLNNVVYVGVVKGKHKKELLLNANVFVFPTYYKMEGQPISLLEAMGFGNIILTTNHAGISDIVTKENGFFVKKKSPKNISDTLIELSNSLSEHKKMSLNNHKYVKEQFSEKKFLSSLKKILID